MSGERGINALVTGVGGPVGQAILKALEASQIRHRVVGTDRSPLSVGLFWVDRGVVLPDCVQEQAYLAAMLELCAEERIDILFPGSDAELRLLACHAETFRTSGVTVMAPPKRVLRIALDKLETCRFLEASGLSFPRYAPLDDEQLTARLVGELGFPIIAKPRIGSGSRGVAIARSWDDLLRVRNAGTPYVVQELLLPADEEYTVASFTAADGSQVGSICMRRELLAGNTYRAWVVENPLVQKESLRVVAALETRGPCNVQLRLTPRGPVTFEVNPRLSGTTAMRAHFGYNEVAMAIRNHVWGESLAPPPVTPGVALRYWAEQYV
jgi:carbamoyl-phosphate synthase large subunit